MTDRCGSYPIKNIAEDFGVDYGDLLEASAVDRCIVLGDDTLNGQGLREWKTPRLGRAIEASERVARQCAPGRRRELRERMWKHATRRWGSA